MVGYKDYYDILGVDRNASKEDIQRAYRKLARKFHPDLNKAADAELKFKEINEAYEVLKDPEKRKKYDQLGSDWQAGQDFHPPPGWEAGFQQPGAGPRGFYWQSGEGADFSDFFETLFGQAAFGGRRRQPGAQGPFGGPRRGEDHEASLRISLEEAFHGGTKRITLTAQSPPGEAAQQKNYTVKIPAGILPGQKIRLAGQGGPGHDGGPAGDLYLRVDVEPHPRFRLRDRDIDTDLPLAPWEAALGAELQVSIPAGGSVTLKVPPGTQSGRKLRLKGKGMPNPNGPPGNLYAEVKIKVPSRLSQKEKRAFEALRDASSFDPRG
jgi:curved DNA-binding protein